MKDFLEIHDFHGLNEIKRTMFFFGFKAPKPAGRPQDSLSTNWGRRGSGSCVNEGTCGCLRGSNRVRTSPSTPPNQVGLRFE